MNNLPLRNRKEQNHTGPFKTWKEVLIVINEQFSEKFQHESDMISFTFLKYVSVVEINLRETRVED